jgi:hypothetical protein
MTKQRKIKVSVILAIALLITFCIAHNEWKYDHAPDVDPGPFLKDLQGEWPILVIYWGVIFLFLTIFYLACALVVDVVRHLFRKLRQRDIGG